MVCEGYIVSELEIGSRKPYFNVINMVFLSTHAYIRTSIDTFKQVWSIAYVSANAHLSLNGKFNPIMISVVF